MTKKERQSLEIIAHQLAEAIRHVTEGMPSRGLALGHLLDAKEAIEEMTCNCKEKGE